jgi:predicted aspartyl protease
LKKQISITTVLFLLLAWVKVFDAHGDAADAEPSKVSEAKLFVAADEASEVLATFKKQERYAPLAEILGSDGTKWYLIRIDTGVTGWMKESDKEAARKLDSYFKPVPIELSFPQPRDPPSSSASSPGNKIAVPVETNGSSVIVRVTFNGSLTANLALDTGATTTVVSRRIARSLRLASLGSRMMVGIGGSVVAPVARIESVKVGDAEVSNLQVSIHDFSPDSRVEGLLGLNFLNQFEISLDSRKRQLFLTPR